MKRALISIIVPVYKVEKYIRKCLDSIINQTYTNLEIILVDDGSPDNCPQICDEYSKKDKRIKVVHQKNMGLSIARNNGIKLAIGDYIGFVDSDDYIENTMFEDLFKALVENDAQMSICNFKVITDKEQYIKNNYPESKTYNQKEFLREILLDKNIQSYAWNKLYEKDLFVDIKYPEGKKYEDIGTTFYLAEKCKKIQLIGKAEYNYINRKNSIVFNFDEQTILDYTDIIMERYDYIYKKYEDLRKYNFYYLAKTLITAYNDTYRLKNISEKLRMQIKKLYLKVENDLEKYEEQSIRLFDEEQKIKLYEILNCLNEKKLKI